MNGNMIPEKWGENTRISERSFFILHGKINMYDVINNLITLSYRSKWKQKNVPDRSNNIFVSIVLQKCDGSLRNGPKSDRI